MPVSITFDKVNADEAELLFAVHILHTNLTDMDEVEWCAVCESIGYLLDLAFEHARDNMKGQDLTEFMTSSVAKAVKAWIEAMKEVDG